jgi:hypothetical protein
LPVAVVFLLRAVVLILLWGFVLAAVVAGRHDVFGTRPRRVRAPRPARPPRPAKPAKPARGRPTPAEAGRPPSKIVVVEGPLTGFTVTLSSLPVTIGRAEDSTIVLQDDYASSHHARLVPSGSAWLLEDLGSTNGTLVDAAKVTAPTEIRAGSQIRIGRTVLEAQP